MMIPGSPASSSAKRWSSGSPHGSIKTTGPAFCGRIASTASNTGSGLITMPGPPPNGMSSTWRWRSCVVYGRSCAWSSIKPRSMARPTTPWSKTGANMPGNIVITSKRIVYLCVLRSDQPFGYDHPASFDVNLDHGVTCGRDQMLDDAFAANPDVIRRALEDFGDLPQLFARLSEDRKPHHLVVIKPPFCERPHLFLGNFEIPASEQLGDGAVVDAAQFEHQSQLARAAPLHTMLGAVEQERRSRIEAIAEVCQGNHLDSPLESVCAGHLAHPDHAGASPPDSGSARRAGCARDGLARSTNTRLRSRSEATRTSVRIASMLRPAFPMKRPTSPSASLTLMATVLPPRSKTSTCTSSGLSASVFATYSTSAR